jgi:hypothetical protein
MNNCNCNQNCKYNCFCYKKQKEKNNNSSICYGQKLANLKPEVYQYYLETSWLNYATTDGWGAYPGISNTSNETYDFKSGYGINKVSIPNGKKLKTIYTYNGIQYLNPYTLVLDNTLNIEVPVYEATGVKRKCKIIAV